ncbi:MAG: DUF2029 domain-containing protein [Bacteroidetes bacterium]|nr:DUF2029 domain-containing protein [Bacteroidota bacterium]
MADTQISVLKKIQSLAMRPGTLLVLYIVGAVFAAVQLYSMGFHMYSFPVHPFPSDIMNVPEKMALFEGKQLTEYNNYLIFKYSFYHLGDGTNLYGLYPDRHWDYYKYSPTFALLMGMIAWMPNVIGMCIWNILNALAVFFAVRLLPLTRKAQMWLLWFVAMELLTCMQNMQSNGLMCGLMIAGYGCMQNGKVLWATLWLALATYIKPYGAIGFCLFLFYPGKIRFILFAILWAVILGALPLLATTWPKLLWQYRNWKDLVIADAASSVGLSVAGWLETWFGISARAGVTLAGIVLFLVPFIRYRMYKDELYRLLTVASMLIWVIIFNHKAESPTFVIAVAGVGIWLFAMPRSNMRTALAIFVFTFTCMATTDLFPPYVKEHLIYPYKMKAFPCILAWVAVFADLLTIKPGMGIAGDGPEIVKPQQRKETAIN